MTHLTLVHMIDCSTVSDETKGSIVGRRTYSLSMRHMLYILYSACMAVYLRTYAYHCHCRPSLVCVSIHTWYGRSQEISIYVYTRIILVFNRNSALLLLNSIPCLYENVREYWSKYEIKEIIECVWTKVCGYTCLLIFPKAVLDCSDSHVQQAAICIY